MKTVRKWMTFSILILIILSACSSNNQIEVLLRKGDYQSVYDSLTALTSPSRRERAYLIHALIGLNLAGHTEHMSALQGMADEAARTDNAPYSTIAYETIDFVKATSAAQYSNVVQSYQGLPIPRPLSAIHLAIQGISCFKIQRYQLAKASLEASLEQNDKAFDVMYYYGRTTEKLGDTNQAIKILNRVVESSQDPQLKGIVAYELARIYLQKKDFVNATENFLRAINNYPMSPKFHYELARLMHNMDYSTISKKLYQATLRLDPEMASAWFYLNVN